MEFDFVETCRKKMDSYFESYGLEFIYADEENIPDEEGMVEKRPTTVAYGKQGLIVELINTLESKFEISIIKLPMERDYRRRVTLYELDNSIHALQTIRHARGLNPIEWILHYENWQERTRVMIVALEESAADFLSGDFSDWDDITSWIKGYRKRWAMDDPIGPAD